MAGGEYEYVAGIYNTSNSYNTYIYNADAKYKNVYSSSTASEAYIPGDATYETAKWKGAASARFVSSGSPVFERSRNGVFGFGDNSGYYGHDGSRVAVVCGVGL